MASEYEYDEEDSWEDSDQDEIDELTGVSDNRCLVAADFDHDIILP